MKICPDCKTKHPDDFDICIYCGEELEDLDLKEVPRRKRTMIRNLKNFTDWIMQHPNYDSAFLPVGDGLLLCLKR